VAIQNLIDLRDSDWSARGKMEVKTIEEFHRTEKQKKLNNEKKIAEMRCDSSFSFAQFDFFPLLFLMIIFSQ
jgi:hypothetical protein